MRRQSRDVSVRPSRLSRDDGRKPGKVRCENEKKGTNQLKDIWEDLGVVAQWFIAIFAIGLIIGAIILAWTLLLGPAFNQADYSNFNSSPQHLQAVAQKFSDDCLQLSETSDPVAKKAIEQDI